MFFQIMISIFNLCFGVARESKLPILFSALLIVCCLIGVCGSTYFSVVTMLLYLMGAAGIIICVVVAVAVTLGLDQNDQGAFIWALYGPFILDLILVLWQTYFIIPVTLWYLKVERQNELEEEEEKKKASQAAAQSNQAGNNAPANVNTNANRNANTRSSNNNNVVAPNAVGIQLNKKQTNSSQANELTILTSQKENKKAVNLDENADKVCVICCVRDKEGAFYPCGHVCTCMTCGNKFKNSFCPVCRKLIVDCVKLYEV